MTDLDGAQIASGWVTWINHLEQVLTLPTGGEVGGDADPPRTHGHR